MTNLDIELARGDPMSDAERAGVAHVLALIDANPRRVVRRIVFKLGPFGLLRGSFAIRAGHFRGLVSWCLASAAEPPYEPPAENGTLE